VKLAEFPTTTQQESVAQIVNSFKTRSLPDILLNGIYDGFSPSDLAPSRRDVAPRAEGKGASIAIEKAEVKAFGGTTTLSGTLPLPGRSGGPPMALAVAWSDLDLGVFFPHDEDWYQPRQWLVTAGSGRIAGPRFEAKALSGEGEVTLLAVTPDGTEAKTAAPAAWRVANGELSIDSTDVRGSSVTVTLEARSINTANKRRDAHLRAPDFLAADTFPEIVFQSTQVEPGTDRDTLRVQGLLTIKAKSAEIILNVNEIDRSCSPSGEHVAYYSALAQLDRHDFGVDALRGLIGRKLQITINLQAIRQM
jgi:polyisoprenoid-binding protein YceI